VSVQDWLVMARGDAERRGLEPLGPLLDGLASSLQALRNAATRMDAEEERTGTAEAAKATAGAADDSNHGGDTPPASVPAPSAARGAAPGGAGGIADLVARLSGGTLKAERLVEDCLARIGARQPELNAFIAITADDALASARKADTEMAAGRPLGPLHGIPLSIKDLIDQAGVPTTAGSRVREGHRAMADAPVTARLRAAGAVFVGKTNLHEFAFGTTNEDSGFGAARHPVDSSRSPGGSSGGSAIAVSTGMSVASVGTDTGGSIRIPSAACGIVGLKPGWGEIPTRGVVPLSRQLDHVGPLACTVADAWLMYDVMRGADSRGLRPQPTPGSLAGLRIGVPRGYLFDRLDEDVERQVLEALERLASAGAAVADVAIPHVADTPHAYLPLVLADGAEFHAATLESRPTDYTPNVRFRLEMGRYVPAEDYVRAGRLRARLMREVDAALTGVDVLALPALAIPAPPVGAVTVPVKGGEEPVRTVMLRCTQLFNMSGHPAVSLPCGVTPMGLPVGLQLVGRRGDTPRLLGHALAVEARLAGA